MRFVRYGMFLLVLAGLWLTACQTEGAVADPAADPGSDHLASEAAGQGERLTIYSGRSESLVQPLIDQFTQETGIQAQVRYGSTGEMAATLLEEGRNSPADLFFAQDPGGLGAISAAGLLAPLPEALLAQVPDRFAAPGQDWVGVSGRARVVVYNTGRLTEADLPADLWGFTDPQWQGRLGWAPTNGSFQAMVTAMRAVWGDERTAEWLQGIQANNPIVFENNTSIVAAVGAGEIDAGLVNHYYLFRFLAEEGEGFPARNYFLPSGGPGSLIMVAGAGILKTAAHPDQAVRFLEFLLSQEAQRYFATETFEYPVIDGITLSPLLPPLQELDAVAANLNLSDLADLEGTVRLLSATGVLP
jgi:iron(III) transport system substrate-binding protein